MRVKQKGRWDSGAQCKTPSFCHIYIKIKCQLQIEAPPKLQTCVRALSTSRCLQSATVKIKHTCLMSGRNAWISRSLPSAHRIYPEELRRRMRRLYRLLIGLYTTHTQTQRSLLIGKKMDRGGWEKPCAFAAPAHVDNTSMYTRTYAHKLTRLYLTK